MPATPLAIVTFVLGVLVAGAGLWLTRPRARTGLTWPVIGVCLVLVGYHTAVWSLPDPSRLLHVPRGRWWIPAVGCVVAVGMTVAMDRAGPSKGGIPPE